MPGFFGGCETMLGIPFHRKIRTGQKSLSWSSVFVLSLLWFVWGFRLFAGGQALTFTIYQYSKDPRVISLIMTGAGLLMLGPVISYLGDQVWTRFGRRKPFLVVAWLGGFLGMFSFAFLPQLAGSVNRVLGLAGIPPVTELAVLIFTIVCYQKMFDCCAPLEPLFMESVPPQQRGRFFAMRGILFTLAVTFFYQVLWPVYDRPVDLFGYLGYPGALVLKGEQLIYIFSGAMFFITGFVLLFCIEEVEVPSAPNKGILEILLGLRGRKSKAVAPVTAVPPPPPKRFRERVGSIPIVTFGVSFFKDVFLKPENIPFYIVLVIPGIEGAVWGNFGPLMQDQQFGYSKASQALWAFPLQIFSMALVTPFAGWYSDVRAHIGWLLLLPAAPVGGLLGWWLGRRAARPLD